MCGLGILENSITSMGHASRSPGTEATRSSPLTAGTMPCAGSSFMAMVPPVVSTITFLLSMSLFLEGEKGRDTRRREEGPFWRKGLPPSSNLLPPSPKTFDRWGGTPDAGTGIRHTPRAGFPPKSILRQHAFIPFKRIRYLSSKKRVEETKHVRKPLHTFPRCFSLPMHPTKQSHPADPPPYGKIPTCHPRPHFPKSLGRWRGWGFEGEKEAFLQKGSSSPSLVFISPTPLQPQTSQALIRAWRNGRS